MEGKIDLKKTYKELYTAKKQPSLVEVPALACLAVDGSGDPNSSQRFQDCVAALYSVAFTLKFSLKKSRGLDWGVLGLEGDWWSEDMEAFAAGRKADWKWTLLIVQPDSVTDAEAAAAIEAAREKAARAKIEASPALAELRFERRPPERAAHILHLGPYDAETENIERLHAFIASNGLRLAGRHREIYLSDARRTSPDKLKTIIRQPCTG